MRFAVGMLCLECNTFSPERTDLDYFRRNGFLLFGEDILEYHRNARNELSGFLDVCGFQGAEVYPTCAAWAVPHGMVAAGGYEALKREFLSRIQDAGPIDGVYLALHGSMVVEGLDDPEGDLLAAVKRLIGKKILCASVDFHANLTAQMVGSADILVGYNSFPHTNLFEAGQKAARLICQYHSQTHDLRRVFIKVPIIAPMEKLLVLGEGPMARIVRDLERWEEEDGVLAMSFFLVQPWLDIQEMGCSVVGVCRKELVGLVQEKLKQAAVEFWRRRREYFDFPFYPPEDAIRQGLARSEQPILLVETADNAGGGAPGDSAAVLDALLRMDVRAPAILPVVDPEAVETAIRAGVGATIQLSLGGRLNQASGRPVSVRGTVKTISDGRYQYGGPVYHGVWTSMGRTVVLEVNGTIWVEVTELPVYTLDPEHYRCVGLHPERMKFVVVKTAASFRASYDAITTTRYYLDTPGVTSSDIRNLPFQRVDTGRLFPYNDALEFRPTALIAGGS
jgi:microcystin degradation protein MlrC